MDVLHTLKLTKNVLSNKDKHTMIEDVSFFLKRLLFTIYGTSPSGGVTGGKILHLTVSY